MRIQEQVAQAIAKSGQSRRQISKATGIDETVLHRIVHGTGGCVLSTLDALCDHLGLELRPRARKVKR